MLYTAVADQAMTRFRCVGAWRTVVVMALVLAMSLDVAHGVRKTPGSAGAATGQTAAAAAAPPPTAASGNTLYIDEGQTAEFRRGRGKAAAAREEDQEAVAVTGSRLPDCTHACGPCSPCKRVMVSFRCAEAAESCPVAYRCMCGGRFFHVPTL